MVVVIGVDAHKKTHTLVALDGNGRKLADKTVEATDAGHATALHWALLIPEGTGCVNRLAGLWFCWLSASG